MGFWTKKVSIMWAVFLPILTFILGPGFVWEWKKADIETGRLDIERARASYDLRAKMTPLLLEILTLPEGSPERLSKQNDFNAVEANLARIEGRAPIAYDFKPVKGYQPPSPPRIVICSSLGSSLELTSYCRRTGEPVQDKGLQLCNSRLDPYLFFPSYPTYVTKHPTTDGIVTV